jgi:hypothetical protein
LEREKELEGIEREMIEEGRMPIYDIYDNEASGNEDEEPSQF